ncbi:MAG: phage major capsid protein [Burkholderiaceae bacterium]|nr:phage major capsid protein [Burkholderiaceae bacterium]
MLTAGHLAGKAAIASAMVDVPAMAAGYARSARWLDGEEVAKHFEQKAAAIATSDIANIGTVGGDFLESAGASALLDRLRLQPGALSTRTFVGGQAVGARVDEGKGMRTSFLAVTQGQLQPLIHQATTVVTGELLALAARSGVGLQRYLAETLAKAAYDAEATSFLDASFAGSAVSQSGATPIASSGNTAANIDTDLAALVAAYLAANNSLESAALILSPAAAVRLSFLRSSGTIAFPGITVLGGTLGGLPVFVSSGADVAGASPAESIVALVDRRRVSYWSGEIELLRSNEATLQLADSVTQSSVATVTATSLVSMFQANAVALSARIHSGWLAAEGSVQIIEGF